MKEHMEICFNTLYSILPVHSGLILIIYAMGSLRIVPVLILVVADSFRSGTPSDAIPAGDSLVLATVNVCSASRAKWAVTIFFPTDKN